MKKPFIIAFQALVMITMVNAQDVRFSQFSNSPLLTNPALTGAFNANHRLTANHRNQWGNIGKGYSTTAFSYDAALFKEVMENGFLGAGIQFCSDKNGELSYGTTNISTSVSCHLHINKSNHIGAAIQAGYFQRKINNSGMRWDAQYDPNSEDGFNSSFATNETMNFKSFGAADFSAGFLWSFSNAAAKVVNNDYLRGNAGLAVFHANRPGNSFDNMGEGKLYSRFSLHSSVVAGISDTRIGLAPSVLINIQGPAKEIVAGMLIRFGLQDRSKYTSFVSESAFSVGGHCRFGDAFIAEALLEIQNWAVGLSYDINTSKLNVASNGNGGLEIALKFITPVVSNKSNPRYF